MNKLWCKYLSRSTMQSNENFKSVIKDASCLIISYNFYLEDPNQFRQSLWKKIMDEIVAILKMSHGSVNQIEQNFHQFHLVLPRWVPKQLNRELPQRVNTCEEVTVRSRRRWFSKKGLGWRWPLDALPPTWNQENQKTMSLFFAETHKMSNTALDRKANPLVG